MFIKTQYGYLNLDTVVCFERNASGYLWRLHLPIAQGFIAFNILPPTLWIEDEESLKIINEYLKSKGVE